MDRGNFYLRLAGGAADDSPALNITDLEGFPARRTREANHSGGQPFLISSFHEKLCNRGSVHTTSVAPAAPPRHRVFPATAPAAGAPLDAR